MRMVWKKHTKLSIGYFILGGQTLGGTTTTAESFKVYVILWYCPGKGPIGTIANTDGVSATTGTTDFTNHRSSATEPF
jgi:hypothetical protein